MYLYAGLFFVLLTLFQFKLQRNLLVNMSPLTRYFVSIYLTRSGLPHER